jgi:UDP:flavonoid glycosyltransferase YjiC (YdhE family)
VSDQFFWGSELERLGVGGKTLKRKGLTVEKLAHGIADALAQPRLTANAVNIGERMSQENGVVRAIELIEKRLGLPRP